jgi:pterin-4a-carbinolamine dehydratase
MPEPIFVSYRREDSSDAAGRLKETIRHRFGEDFVFMDTSAIGPGDKWAARLQAALEASRVVLAVIGPGWLRASDDWGSRRIDEPDDWVRKELDFALANDKVIVPVMIGGAVIPPSDKLPPSLVKLFDSNVLEVRSAYWDHDLEMLYGQLKRHTSHPESAQDVAGPYPIPPADRPDALSDEKLQIALSASIPKWRTIASPLPEDPERVRVELFREFTFKSFRGAIAFMVEVAPGCDIATHHPRWENIWRTTRVYLTTFDIGHRISDRDVQLAKYFDRAYADFPDASPAATRER